MNAGTNRTGQYTPMKTPDQFTKANKIVDAYRQVLAKYDAKPVEQRRQTRPFASTGMINQRTDRHHDRERSAWQQSNARYRQQISADSARHTNLRMG